MKRMSKSELLDIIDKGLSKCEGLTIEAEARDRIADYSQGVPFYTHLLARESALQAVRNDRTIITMSDLNEAVKEAVDSQLETNLSAYTTAVSAPRGKNFKPLLLACALANKNEQHWFYARDVVAPLRLITSKEYNIPAFAKHLKAFCEQSRGKILERRGPPKRVRYRFTRPLMEPLRGSSWPSRRNHRRTSTESSFGDFHRARAAFTAIWRLCSTDRDLALAGPPFFPPAARLLFGTFGSSGVPSMCSPMASSTTVRATCMKSRFCPERFGMAPSAQNLSV